MNVQHIYHTSNLNEVSNVPDMEEEATNWKHIPVKDITLLSLY